MLQEGPDEDAKQHSRLRGSVRMDGHFRHSRMPGNPRALANQADSRRIYDRAAASAC
jgi:hypothetical protein